MNKYIDLEKSLEKNNYSEVREYVTQHTQQLKTFFKSLELVELESEIERTKSHFSFLVKKELFQKNVHFLFGRYIGFVDALYEQLVVENKKKILRHSLESCDISEIPHVNDIIITIYQNEGIRHGKLAQSVGIEKSTLSGIMDKLVDKGAVSFSRPGKYKYYYLTDLGNKYYFENRTIIEAGTNIDSLTEQLLLALSKDDNANKKIIQIIEALFNGKNSFKGYRSPTKPLIDPALIFAGMPNIKQLTVKLPNSSNQIISGAKVLKSKQQQDIVFLLNKKSNNFVNIPEVSI